MSEGLLPHTVNTRKAVARAAHYSGALGVDQLEAVADVLRGAGSSAVRADVRFARDDEERQIVTVDISASVSLPCQRCLEPYTQAIESHSELAIVRSDEEARQLPSRYEPLLASEDTDLWRVVAEELALALPVVGYHERGSCPSTRKVPDAGSGDAAGDAADDNETGKKRDKPFAALSALLQGDRDDPGSD